MLPLSFLPQCQITKCSVLVCWLGRESLQKESLGLVRDLWAQGISADILYESMEKDNIEDIQKFCREVKIPHIVILGDKTLYFERKQVSTLCVCLLICGILIWPRLNCGF